MLTKLTKTVFRSLLPMFGVLALIVATGAGDSHAGPVAKQKPAAAAAKATGRAPVHGLRGAKAAAASVLVTRGGAMLGNRFTALRLGNRRIEVTEKQDDGFVGVYSFTRALFGLGKSFELTEYVAANKSTGRRMPPLKSARTLAANVGSTHALRFRPMTVASGEHLDDTVAKAASLSRRLGRDVVFTHNSTTYTVPANSSDSVTAAQLQQARIGDDF